MTARGALGLCVLVCLGCGGAGAAGYDGIRRSADVTSDADAREVRRDRRDPGGYIVFYTGGQPWRLEAVQGAKATNISEALNGLSPGKDDAIGVSKNGEWIALVTERFDCQGYACLSLVHGDLTGGERVEYGSKQKIHPAGRAVVTNDGKRIVYVSNDGPHSSDLFLVEAGKGGWSEPRLLTKDAVEPYNEFPALNAAGTKLVFDCSPVPYGQEGTDTCVVNMDGSGLAKVIDSELDPLGSSPQGHQPAMHHPDFAPDGSIVVEGDWGGEQVWRLESGATKPVLVGSAYSNDNSPCVLPSGYIASLWLGDPQGTGQHELKVMRPDGTDPLILTPTSRDIDDVGMSCHGPLTGQPSSP